jgi:hypothetical protein
MITIGNTYTRPGFAGAVFLTMHYTNQPERFLQFVTPIILNTFRRLFVIFAV